MSRMFNALQEAARLRGRAKDGEAIWKELGITLPVTSETQKPETATPEVEGAASAVFETPESKPTPAVLQAASVTAAPTRLLLDKRARLIPHTPDPIVLERYRMLRTKILQERERKFFRSLVVTSASPQEGKTVTVLNLALSLAALPSFKLLVVDGDMRRGTLGDWLGIDKNRPGLSNLIEGSAEVSQVLLKSDDLSMCVIPRGNAQVSDLHPSHFSTYFRHLVEQFDLVLVDTPPVNIITDVQMMAASCDAVMLVARAFSTTTKSLEDAADKLRSFRIIGAVLNAGMSRGSRSYQGYY